MNKMTNYQAPWGRSLKVVSGLIVLLAVALPVALPTGAWDLARLGLPLLVIACLPFVVRGYEVTDDAILVRRLFWKTHLDRGDLVSAEVLPHAMRGCLRTCGNGGIFSFTGWYWSRGLGAFHAYVTDHDRTVVLRFGKRTVVISPDRPEAFVRELMNAATGDRRHGADS
jgi:hypothetical protein